MKFISICKEKIKYNQFFLGLQFWNLLMTTTNFCTGFDKQNQRF